MSFPRYPEDKDSGVEWLGEVPGHWEVKALKNVISRIESGVSVNAIDTPAAEGEIGVLKTSCVYRGWFDPAENKAVVPEEYERVACPVTAGTLIVSRMNTPDLVGAAGMVGESHPGLFLPDRLWQVHFADAHAAFIHYWTRSPLYRAQVQQVCAGASSSMQNLAQDQFRAFILALPPVREQTAIAAFLDRETAKIDALVAEQQNLIALLKEKRQALISHAVTKGLDPDAPMKDSGVAWLGEVPAHWRVCSLRRAIAKIEQGWSPDCHARPAEAGEWGVLKAGCVNGGKYRPTENKALPSELLPDESYCVEVGDVLMSRASGSPDLVGSTALVRETPGRLMLSDKIFRLRLEIDVAPAFFVAMLNARALRAQIEQALSGGNGLANNLPQSNLLAFICALPPEEEQVAIAARLNRDIEGLDQLMAEAESTISLLIERRTALISAAVTGKIDVRHLAVASAEPTPEPA